MARLDDQVKLFIVQAVAHFDTPSEVAEAVSESFGVQIDRRQVETYDPTKARGRDLSKKLRAVFDQTRKAFLEETATIPIAKQAFRLRHLQRLHRIANERKNIVLAAQILEQAAKEAGGMFTNRREHSGPGGAPIPVGHSGSVEHMHSLSDAELERIAAGLPRSG